MSNVYPSGWGGSSYLVTLTNYSDQASAAAGVTTNAPTGAASGGSISYWNGSGFITISTSTLNTPGGGTIPVQVARAGPWQQGTGPSRRWVCATITPSLSYGGPSTSSVGSPRTSAKASMGAPIKGTVGYKVDIYSTNPNNCTTPTGLLLSTPVDLTVSIDLGSANVTTTYKPAPTGG
jgi:hypothetical protein